MARLPVRVIWFAVPLGVVLVLLLFLWSRNRTVRLHHAVPHDLEVAASVVGFPDEVRYFPRDPGDIKLMTKEFVDSWEREKAYLKRQDLPPTSYLAISGGGDNGAFSAGFLNGWTKAGTRPLGVRSAKKGRILEDPAPFAL